MTDQTMRMALRKSVSVRRSPEEAFHLYTDGIDTWWPRRTHSVGEERAATVGFESRAGGRIFERTDDGTGAPVGDRGRVGSAHANRAYVAPGPLARDGAGSGASLPPGARRHAPRPHAPGLGDARRRGPGAARELRHGLGLRPPSLRRARADVLIRRSALRSPRDDGARRRSVDESSRRRDGFARHTRAFDGYARKRREARGGPGAMSPPDMALADGQLPGRQRVALRPFARRTARASPAPTTATKDRKRRRGRSYP